MRLAKLALAMTTLGVLSSPLAARDIAVTYADLDISAASGRQKLEMRAKAAARVACGVFSTRQQSVIERSESRRCYNEAVLRAQSRIAAVAEQRLPGG